MCSLHKHHCILQPACLPNLLQMYVVLFACPIGEVTSTIGLPVFIGMCWGC